MLRFALCALLALPTTSAFAGIMTTITDTQPIIDYPLCRCGTPLPAVLDFALFDFTGQPELATITGLDISLTMEDGDTGLGDFDYDNLRLTLDDVDVGIPLNGFSSGQEMSINFAIDDSMAGFLSGGALEQLLLNLQDGQLFASIVDLTPDDNTANLYSLFDTTIRIKGMTLMPNTEPVPEPATLAIWGLILMGALAQRVRRWRRSRVQPSA